MNRGFYAPLVAASVLLLLADAAAKVCVTQQNNDCLTVELFTEEGIRTAESRPPGRPSVGVGNLVQSRQQARLSFEHIVTSRKIDGPWKLINDTFEALVFRSELRPSYEGITRYGPSALRANRHRDDLALQ